MTDFSRSSFDAMRRTLDGLERSDYGAPADRALIEVVRGLVDLAVDLDRRVNNATDLAIRLTQAAVDLDTVATELKTQVDELGARLDQPDWRQRT